MSFHLDGYSIVFANGKRHTFPDLINQAVEFEDVVILRLDTDSLQRTNQNVYAFDYRGSLLWQIPVRRHMTEHSPCVGLYRHGEMIEAYNWDGHTMTLHPRLGSVMTEGTISVGSDSSRRPRPTRSFI
jgi:hypothetical protein